jgi:membrane protein implicated in regulation of membrane protease activity
MVFVDGELWSAQSSDAQPIPVGDHVTVERVEGLKLVVRKAAQNG